MKLSALMITVAAMAALSGGAALADATTPPVTMQPIPNPPEKAMAPKASKHHKSHKAAAKPAEAKTDATTPAPDAK